METRREGHDVLQPMNVAGCTAKFVVNVLISERANYRPDVRSVRLLRVE